ncbi:MAG: respiratory nitrate reductase subunit gamma [Planctomycetota bacterium]|jgi:nitrate reductase gamma subunit
MEVVRFLVGGILPYVAVLVFVAAMIYRIAVWRKMAQPSITLFPAPPTKGANTANTVQEAVFFKSLFRGDRLLWVFAWGFHVVLALIFVGHFRVFINADAVLMRMGMSGEGIDAMSAGVGGAAGVVILITVLFLLIRRMTIPRVREITGFGDYFALILIGAILITGNLMRFGGEHFDLTQTREYFAALATFSGAAAMPVLENNVFLLHMGLAFVLMIVIPFSKILHLGGIFFTHQLVRKH